MRKESFMSTWTDNLVFLKDGVYRRFLANDSIVLNGASITAATFVGDLTGNADSATSAAITGWRRGIPVHRHRAWPT
jgi:hypothetical protein